MGSVCEHLFKALRGASVHNPEVQVAPACVLWPDKDRQWEAVIPVLQGELQELLVLGRGGRTPCGSRGGRTPWS